MLIEATKRVRNHMRIYYNVDLGDLEISDIPGCWQDKEPRIHPGHPLHRCLFCDGAFRATYKYLDPIRDSRGRFSSPYRTWRLLRQCEIEKKDECRRDQEKN